MTWRRSTGLQWEHRGGIDIEDSVIRPLREDLVIFGQRLSNDPRTLAGKKVNTLDGRVSTIGRKLDTIDGKLDNLLATIMGPVSERQAQATILVHLLDLAPEVSGMEVLLSQADKIGKISGEYQEAVTRARSAGLLEDPAADQVRLFDTDMVIRARSGEHTFMVAVEVSPTVDNADVRRAVRSASLLNRVFGVRAIPVVVGPSICPATLEYAEREGVDYIWVEPEANDTGEIEEGTDASRASQ